MPNLCRGRIVRVEVLDPQIAMVSSTIKAATLFAAGQAATTGTISVKVAALTQGVLKTMLWSKLKVATVMLLAMAAVGVGSGGIIYRICAAEPPQTANPVEREIRAKSDRDQKPKSAPALADEVKAALAQVEEARARLALAEAQLKLAKAKLNASKEELPSAEAKLKRHADRLIRPQYRKITATIGQPGSVQAYERTSIYSRATGYIEKWNVDIGDKVKKGDVLATISAPDLREELESKYATVKLAHLRVERARKAVARIKADIKTAESHRTTEAELLSKRAAEAESELAVKVAEAELAVAASDAKRLAIRVGYLTLTSPYDGIIVARNANTSDFVSPDKKEPIYAISRVDIVRVFIDIPESEANYVRVGTKARVQIKAFRDEWLPAAVTRTSWALDVKNRTLRVEIDLANPGAQLLPGMYAYGKVIVERPNVLALPVSALERIDGQTFYRGYAKDRVVRTEVQTGISDGSWIEVVKRRSPGSGENDRWEPIDGSEQVIPADPSRHTKP